MNVQATFAATLVDEWARAGVRRAVVCPGSRSTPLAVALDLDPRIAVVVRIDERGAGFHALGIGLASGIPAVVVTTSGTAAAELHPAVVEAHQACVPMIVCTADRPPELRDVGAPQSIDQRGLYGGAVRWYCDPGVPAGDRAGDWRPLAARAIAAALAHPLGAGPVQLNLPFREPLVGDPGELPAGRVEGRPWHAVAPSSSAPLPGVVERLAGVLAAHQRGLVLAGEGCNDLAAADELAMALGWPLVAGPQAWPRLPTPRVVAAADAILRAPSAVAELRPEVVLRLGAPPLSRVVTSFVDSLEAEQVLVDERWPWRDAGGSAGEVVRAAPDGTATALSEALGRRDGAGAWLDAWTAAEAAAQDVIVEVIGAEEQLSEPGLARALYDGLPGDGRLFVSSSMPMRDVEWFARARLDPPRIHANRGANGIDGILSTALGIATTAGGPVAALVGDLAFMHDISGLAAGIAGGPPLDLIVVDNHGGGIFSFLPQASALAEERFERLFGTPQRVGPATTARALGCEVLDLRSPASLGDLLASPPSGVRVAVLRSDRAANAVLHADLAARVIAHLERLWS